MGASAWKAYPDEATRKSFSNIETRHRHSEPDRHPESSPSTDFCRSDVDPQKRENVGLQAVFNSVFPIRDFNDTAQLEFVSYTLEKPKYDVTRSACSAA